MRDAIGGVFNIWFLMIFIVFVSGYLAFSVSYSKAFKVKNKIISVIEQYQGYNDNAAEKIDQYIDKLGYNRASQAQAEERLGKFDTSGGWTCPNNTGYCYKKTYVDGDENGSATGRPKSYYSVVTFVNVEIPIFEKFLPYLSFFHTSGDTMTIYED